MTLKINILKNIFAKKLVVYCAIKNNNIKNQLIKNNPQNFDLLLRTLYTWTWAGGPSSDVVVAWMFRRGGSWCVGLRGDWGILVPELVIGCSVEKASIVLLSTKTIVEKLK